MFVRYEKNKRTANFFVRRGSAIIVQTYSNPIGQLPCHLVTNTAVLRENEPKTSIRRRS